MDLINNLPNNLGFDGKYASYPLHLAGLPSKIILRGDDLLLKDEFHCSLISIDKLSADYGVDGQALLDAFAEQATLHPLTFGGYKSELRLVHRDERRSLVVMCSINGLNSIFNELRKQFAFNLPFQPTHVTLYTLQPNAGIGISSDEDLARITEKLDGEELISVMQAINFEDVFGANNG